MFFFFFKNSLYTIELYVLWLCFLDLNLSVSQQIRSGSPSPPQVWWAWGALTPAFSLPSAQLSVPIHSHLNQWNLTVFIILSLLLNSLEDSHYVSNNFIATWFFVLDQ